MTAYLSEDASICQCDSSWNAYDTYRDQGHDVEPEECEDSVEESKKVEARTPAGPPQRPTTPSSPPRRSSSSSSPSPSSATAEGAPRRLKRGAGGRARVAGELDGLLDGVGEGAGVGAADALELGGALEDDEGRHRGDLVRRRDRLLVVDVDLAERDLAGLRELRRQRFERRRDHLAGAAPVGVDCGFAQTMSALLLSLSTFRFDALVRCVDGLTVCHGDCGFPQNTPPLALRTDVDCCAHLLESKSLMLEETDGRCNFAVVQS